jgi:gas vesicle protein
MAVSKSAAGSDNEGVPGAQAGVAGMGLAGADAAGVEKIRELLFGNQMSDYDRRFSALEDRFQQSIRDVESEATRSLTSLESTIKKQLESCVNQLREEKDLRTDADKDRARDQREQSQSLDKRLGQLSEQLAKLEREITERLGHETQSLREEIKRRNDDTRNTIERMFAELSSVKTDRNLLAGLFVEIAKCLNQEIAPKRIGKIGNGE